MMVTAAEAGTALCDTALGPMEYRDLGPDDAVTDRRPLLVLTGFGATIGHWPGGLVDPLAARRRLVIVQNPGVGRSAPRESTEHGCSALAARVAALADELDLGLGLCDVLGWSMGGMVAQALAVTRPDLVARLVLAASAPGTGTAVGPQPGVLAELSSGDPARMLEVLFPDDPDAAAAYRTAVAGDPALGVAPGPVLAAQGRATRRWRDGDEPAGTRTPGIAVPVLVLHGDRDRLAPPANADRLAEVFTTVAVHHDPDAGHGVLFSDPTAVAARIDRWLESTPVSGDQRPNPHRCGCGDSAGGAGRRHPLDEERAL